MILEKLRTIPSFMFYYYGFFKDLLNFLPGMISETILLRTYIVAIIAIANIIS